MARKMFKYSISGLMASFGAAAYFVSCESSTKNTLSDDNKISLDEAFRKAEGLCQRVKEESGSSGLVLGVSVDGSDIFTLGILVSTPH